MKEINIDLKYEAEFHPRTLVELLQFQACRRFHQIAYTFLVDGETTEANLTYSQLDHQVRGIAATLQSLGLEVQDRALLLFQPGLEYIAAFLGCLYAGVIAVPAYPPHRKRKRNSSRLMSIIADSQAKVVLTMESTIQRFFDYAPELKELLCLTTDNISRSAADEWVEPQITSQTPAFLQYTSGSTGTPKGVMLSHGNLLYNQRMIKYAFGHTEKSRIVGWLPLYHDMGLIGNVLHPLYMGISCILMSPIHFMQRPLRWLSAISRYKATTSGGPNFAYNLCTEKIRPEQHAMLDLSCWNIAFNGSEPIQAQTMDQFAKTFESCGFRKEAFYPCYGLAEATLIVSGTEKNTLPYLKVVNKHKLEQNRVVEVKESSANGYTLVCCGRTILDQKIVIVDPKSLVQCSERQVGEVWVAGPNIAHGYWNQPEETSRTFKARIANSEEGPFLRTGDLGFLQDGQLFITGRIKDLIIIRGRNHYPQDIECTVEKVHSALSDSAAAFSVEIENEDQLVVVQEVAVRQRHNLDGAIEAILKVVTEEHEVQPYSVILIKPGSLPRTSSGKIQRYACKQDFLKDNLAVLAKWQMGSIVKNIAPHEVPQTKLQQVLAEIWTDVLNLEQVGINDNFFSLGGDSLHATQVAARLSETFSIDVNLVSLFETPTIAELADMIEDAQQSSGRLLLTSPTRIVRQGQLPLSFAQQRLWFLNQLAPDSPYYNISVAAALTGPLNLAALEQSLGKIIQRHEVLRTIFLTVKEQPTQVIIPFKILTLPVVDIGGLSEKEQQTKTQQIIMAEAQQPFDLAKGPPLRVKLLHLTGEDHVFLLTAHHIITDGWSMGLFAQELAKIYKAFSIGITSPLSELPIQYVDFSHWQQQWLRGKVLETQLSYWKRQLANELPALKLPTDKARPAVQTFRGARQSTKLPKHLIEALRTLYCKDGKTMFMTLLAVFQTLLYRYTGQNDLVIGSLVANRKQAKVEQIIGFFVNSLVIRINLSSDLSFRKLLNRVSQVTLEAYTHQDLPFERLVEELKPQRDLSYSPLFQVMFDLHSVPELEFPGLSVRQLEVDNGTSQFDLSLSIEDTKDGLQASLEYNTDLFEAITIARMLGHFHVLLKSVVAKPEQKLSNLSILTDAEQRQLLIKWNDTKAKYPEHLCIHQLFEAQVSQTPDAIAIIFEDRQLTYRELNHHANKLAHHLRELGVKPEVLVGILLERSLEMVIGILGVLKAGGAYVPLDPAYPKERLACMMEDTQNHILLTQERLVEPFWNSIIEKTQIVCFHINRKIVAQEGKKNPANKTAADNIACVVYTSGSRGQPKGVLITNRSIVNLTTSFIRCYHPTTSDSILPLTSISSASFVGEIFPLLCTGGTLVLPNKNEVLDFEKLFSVISKHRVTILSTIPAVTTELNVIKNHLPKVRLILSGGETLLSGNIDKLLESTTIVNGYGLTEATICSTSYHLNQHDLNSNTTIPIGKPIINNQIYILDKNLNCMPTGCCGELYIAGVGLVRGYLKNQELTAVRFIPNPYAHGKRMYRTGDLAKWLPDGNIEFIGRLDRQVQIRGFRIELQEIEAILSQHPAVQDSVVIVQENSLGDKRLVAYVTLRQEQMIKDSELRSWLRNKVPDYMVPSVLEILSALPLTSNGKVDLKRLPPPKKPYPELEATNGAPKTKTEQIIANIWQEVLQRKKIGIYDNFFDLGGHSLLMTKAHRMIREEFEQDLSMVDMFRYPTISTLTRYLDEKHIEQTLVNKIQDRTQKQRLAIKQQQKLIARRRKNEN